MKIKENIITTMDQPEAMQEDGDNWNQEEMLQAAAGLIELASDLQSSGTSTSTSPPESDSDCENARGLVLRPIAQEKYRFRSATKRFNALKFEEQCFHFKKYLRSPDTFRTYPYFITAVCIYRLVMMNINLSKKFTPHMQMVTGSVDVTVTQLLCYHMPLLYATI